MHSSVQSHCGHTIVHQAGRFLGRLPAPFQEGALIKGRTLKREGHSYQLLGDGMLNAERERRL